MAGRIRIPKNNKNVSPRKKKVRSARRKAQSGGVRTVAAPAAFGVINTPPTVTTNKGKSFNVCHRELVTSDATSMWGTFAPRAYIINPARSMFPWLKQIAPSFDKYVINKLEFDWVPLAPTSMAGHVRAYIDYDPLDPIPTDPEGFSQMDGMSAFPLWSPTKLKYVPPARIQYYTGSEGADEDRFSDAGTLAWYTESTLANQAAGEWWVSYDITFFKPQANDKKTLVVGGDAYTDPATKPGPATPGQWYIDNINHTVAIVREGIDLARQMGVSYDTTTRTITMPARSDRAKQIMTVLARTDDPYPPGNVTIPTASDFIRVANASNVTVTPIPSLDIITPTTGPFTAQRGFEIQNMSSGLPGTFRLEFGDYLGQMQIQNLPTLTSSLQLADATF